MAEIAQLFTAEQANRLSAEQKTRLAKLTGPDILLAVELQDKIAEVARPSK
jgi:hypothetical protein